jgi:hypothetical protein
MHTTKHNEFFDTRVGSPWPEDTGKTYLVRTPGRRAILVFFGEGVPQPRGPRGWPTANAWRMRRLADYALRKGWKKVCVYWSQDYNRAMVTNPARRYKYATVAAPMAHAESLRDHDLWLVDAGVPLLSLPY